MITLFLLSLVAAALILAAVPVILFALMLETANERSGADPVRALARDNRDDEESPLSIPAMGMV